MTALRVNELAPGLWRWTCSASPCARGEIASFYCETGSAILLVDPVLPEPGSADHAKFFRALDADVARLAMPVALVATSAAHGRDLPILRACYAVTDAPLPDGVLAAAIGNSRGERAIWLPSHGALVAGHASPEEAREALGEAVPGAIVRLLLGSHGT